MERRLGLLGAMLGILLCAFVTVLLGSSLAYGAPKDGEVRIHVMPTTILTPSSSNVTVSSAL